MVFDHEGKVYEDVEAMCAAYNINPGTFNSRIRSNSFCSIELSTILFFLATYSISVLQSSNFRIMLLTCATLE